MLISLLTAAALAGGFYHPNDIAGESTLFAKASAGSTAPLEAANVSLTRLSAALVAYEESLDLLGDRAPAAERERLDQLRIDYNRKFAKLQAFADAVIEDFDAEFTGAMERALAAHGSADVCERLVPAGRALPGMPARMEKNPACTGDDLNPTAAAAMDADPVLQQAVAEIVAITWPAVDLDAAPQTTVGPSDRWIDVRTFVGAVAREGLREIARADARDRAEFEMSIAEGASNDELAQYVTEAKALTARTAAARAAVAAPLLTAAEGVLEKWAAKGQPATGWCANPATLGGCTGEPAPSEVVQALVDDKKVGRAR
ncbi:MAG: hypothetical protein ACI8PZ_004216 [Myxococcota bacterium]|jgi:hypothetical protein